MNKQWGLLWCWHRTRWNIYFGIQARKPAVRDRGLRCFCIPCWCIHGVFCVPSWCFQGNGRKEKVNSGNHVTAIVLFSETRRTIPSKFKKHFSLSPQWKITCTIRRTSQRIWWEIQIWSLLEQLFSLHFWIKQEAVQEGVRVTSWFLDLVSSKKCLCIFGLAPFWSHSQPQNSDTSSWERNSLQNKHILERNTQGSFCVVQTENSFSVVRRFVDLWGVSKFPCSNFASGNIICLVFDSINIIGWSCFKISFWWPIRRHLIRNFRKRSVKRAPVSQHQTMRPKRVPGEIKKILVFTICFVDD